MKQAIRAALARPPAFADGERRQLIADLFHALNQPLTTLRCSLELTLVQPRTPEENARALEQALTQAEQASWLAAGLRELVASDDPGDEREVVELEMHLQQVVLDLLPLAEVAGVCFIVRRSSVCCVLFEPLRLRRALFYLLEYALDTVPRGTTIQVEIREKAGEAALELTTSLEESFAEPSPAAETGSAAWPEPARQLGRRLQLAIARGLLEAAGGWFHLESSTRTLSLEVTLPLTIFPH